MSFQRTVRPVEGRRILNEDEIVTCLPCPDYDRLNDCRGYVVCAPSVEPVSSSPGLAGNEDEPEAPNADPWEAEAPGVEVDRPPQRVSYKEGGK